MLPLATGITPSESSLIAAGNSADILVFDPATLRDRATYAEPHQYAEGVETVVVNGVVTVRDGELTGERAGRFLA